MDRRKKLDRAIASFEYTQQNFLTKAERVNFILTTKAFSLDFLNAIVDIWHEPRSNRDVFVWVQLQRTVTKLTRNNNSDKNRYTRMKSTTPILFASKRCN